MARGKKRIAPTSIDFQFGTGRIIPATQEAFRGGVHDKKVRVMEKQELVQFRKEIGRQLDIDLRENEQFSTDNDVFVFIIQYFAGNKEYRRRDIDNISKTILDVLKDRFYRDDSQVRTLLAGKKMDLKVSQNFGYVAIKELRGNKEVDALKISGIVRSVTLFHDLKKQGLL